MTFTFSIFLIFPMSDAYGTLAWEVNVSVVALKYKIQNEEKFIHVTWTHLPAFHASPTCGFAVFKTHEAKAMQTKHMSECLRGSREASNPLTELQFKALSYFLKIDIQQHPQQMNSIQHGF